MKEFGTVECQKPPNPDGKPNCGLTAPAIQDCILQIIARSSGCYITVLILILIKMSTTTKQSRTRLEEETDRSCTDSGSLASIFIPIKLRSIKAFCPSLSFSGDRTQLLHLNRQHSPLCTWGGRRLTGHLIRYRANGSDWWVDVNKDDPLLSNATQKTMAELSLSNFKVNHKVEDWQNLTAWNKNDRNKMPRLMRLPVIVLV